MSRRRDLVDGMCTRLFGNVGGGTLGASGERFTVNGSPCVATDMQRDPKQTFESSWFRICFA